MEGRTERFKVEKTVFDRFTVKTLRKLESDGFLIIEELQPLFMGKEANVFIAEGNAGMVAVKIYRLQNADFNNMYSYIVQDPRFSVRKNKRDVILLWVQREYANLLRARRVGVTVPTPFLRKENVLVMELVGPPANKLKDQFPKNPDKFYKQVCEQVKLLWDGGLVHADLSQFNILNHEENPVLIDFSQSITTQARPAMEYLERDMKNINRFFRKLGVKDIKDAETVIK